MWILLFTARRHTFNSAQLNLIISVSSDENQRLTQARAVYQTIRVLASNTATRQSEKTYKRKFPADKSQINNSILYLWPQQSHCEISLYLKCLKLHCVQINNCIRRTNMHVCMYICVRVFLHAVCNATQII